MLPVDLVLVGIFNGAGILDLLFHCLPVSHILRIKFKFEGEEIWEEPNALGMREHCQTIQGPTCMDWWQVNCHLFFTLPVMIKLQDGQV